MAKAAMCWAALEIPGMKKAQIGRLVLVKGETFPLYGVPVMHMDASVVTAGFPPAPDVRTRAMIKEWAAKITIEYVRPALNETSIVNLLDAAGTVCGFCDLRPQKGKGNNGCFHVCSESDVKDIVKSGGIKAQDAALKDPRYANDLTKKLYEYHCEYAKRTGKTRRE
jgi:hypothetical protein